MAGSFPTSVTTYTNPAPGDVTSTELGTRDHQELHADVNDDLEQVMTKLGTGASTATAGTVLRGTGAGTTAFGAIVSGDITDGTIVNADINSAAAITVSKLAAGGTARRVVATTDGTTMAMADVINLIAANTILAGHIGLDTINQFNLAADCVTSSELADNAVDTAAIVAGAVTAYSQVVGSTSSPTQASGTPAVILQMAMTPTLIGGGVQLLVFECTVENTAASAVTQFSIRIGGSNVATRAKLSLAANERTQIFIIYVRASVAGTPTIDVTWLVTSGTATAIGTERSLTSIEWKK